MQGDFITRNDDKLSSGYGSALLVREYGDRFFNLVIPLEKVPSVSGDYETFDYNSLLSDVKSKVRGKLELSSVTADFVYSRENILRLDELVNRSLEYMRINKNYTYEIFTAEMSYKAQDAEADVLKGEITLTPSALGEKGVDGRSLIRQTLEFSQSLPDSVSLTTANNSKTFELSLRQADATPSYEISVEGNVNITATETNGKLTISASGVESNGTAMIFITAKSEKTMETAGDSSALKYAPWTMTIAVDYTHTAS